MCELTYQLLYAESEDVVLEDARLRYGERAEQLLSEAKQLLQQLLEQHNQDRDAVARQIVEMCPDFVSKIIDRVASSRDLAVLAYFFSKAAFTPLSETILRTLIEVMDLRLDLSELIRDGILMHVSQERVMLPAFVESYVSQPECTVDVDSVLDSLEHNYVVLAALESVIESVRPVDEIFEKMYGVTYDEALQRINIKNFAKYSAEDNEVVFNPCLDLTEVRTKLHEFKQVKAKKLITMFDITLGYGKYNKKLGVITHVVAFGPGMHGVIIAAPWLVPSRRLERHMSNVARLIILSVPFRKEFADYYHQLLEQTSSFRKTAFVFVQEGVAYLVAPEKRDKVLDTLIDFVYRAGLEVLEF